MAYDTATLRCRRPANDGDGTRAAETTLPPPSSPGGPAAGSFHWAPAAARYTEQPMPWSTRLVGIGGTGLACFTLAVLLLVRWHDTPPPIQPATLSVFEIAQPEAPPAPDTEIPPGPEQVRKVEPPKVEVVETPPPIPVPNAHSIIMPVAKPVHDPGPPVMQTTAPESVLLSPGSRVSDEKPSWEGQVLAALDRVKRYPREASFRRQQGVPWIRFVIDREGRVRSVRLETPSGFDALDREALALPYRAQPLPKPPESVVGDRIDLVVPVEFFM